MNPYDALLWLAGAVGAAAAVVLWLYNAEVFGGLLHRRLHKRPDYDRLARLAKARHSLDLPPDEVADEVADRLAAELSRRERPA